MLIRSAQVEDIETLFDIRTSVTENYQSREEIAALGITPESIAEMLATDCRAWIAEHDRQQEALLFELEKVNGLLNTIGSRSVSLLPTLLRRRFSVSSCGQPLKEKGLADR